MRLAIIRQRYTPQGGAERFLEGALEALLERNVAITLYTREWPRDQAAADRAAYLQSAVSRPAVARLGLRPRRHAARSPRPASTSCSRTNACCPATSSGPADGVHATWLEERLHDASASLRWRVAMSPWHRYTLAMERKLFASPWLRAVLCNSKMVRDDIKARFGLPDERLPVLYNAVDSSVFSPALRAHRERDPRASTGSPDDATLFLLVGSGFRRKGVPAAIAALARLPAPAHLIVVGDDRKLDAYKRLAHEHGVRERVTFAGYQNDVAPFYGAADAFVLPAIYDSFPDAAMEALASGLPVVTSTKSGAAELVAENDAGFVCDVARRGGARRAHAASAAGPRRARAARRERAARGRCR